MYEPIYGGGERAGVAVRGRGVGEECMGWGRDGREGCEGEGGVKWEVGRETVSFLHG